ncbi:response regulator [Planococcus sp. CAU13]|uniref:response regulator n=1 Tax=Planococcus sp. CAU13 TaxID=1541197 RepID=UPI00052FDFB0|nr:response regulator [Planococcus sp. CAU13]
MKAILVDDELLALDYLEWLLCKAGNVTIAGKFMDSLKALEAIALMKPDIVFLDVEMPGMNGIELAEKIKSSWSGVQVIFVTAYNHYAVKAFELNAVDYLLKPVQFDRLQESLSRISSLPAVAATGAVQKIKTLQRLSFISIEDGTEQEMQVKWRTSKVRSVFAYLLQQHDKPVRKDILLEEFWPDLSVDKGYVQLYGCIYQIRKTIASVNFNVSLTNYEHAYQLSLGEVKLDVDEWEQQLENLPELTEETVPLYQKAISAYSGTYLAEEEFVWADYERERLNMIWFQQLKKLADYLANQRRFAEAITIYLQMQAAFPYLDASYLQLMQLFKELGDYHSVRHQFSRLKEMLLEEYGTDPDEAALQLLEACLQAD